MGGSPSKTRIVGSLHSCYLGANPFRSALKV